MSAIEDTRRVLQDFLAPELREIRTRLDAIDKRLDGVDKHFDQIDKRFDQTDRRADERHAEILRMFAALNDIRDLRERMARIEAQQAPSSGTAAA